MSQSGGWGIVDMKIISAGKIHQFATLLTSLILITPELSQFVDADANYFQMNISDVSTFARAIIKKIKDDPLNDGSARDWLVDSIKDHELFTRYHKPSCSCNNDATFPSMSLVRFIEGSRIPDGPSNFPYNLYKKRDYTTDPESSETFNLNIDPAPQFDDKALKFYQALSIPGVLNLNKKMNELVQHDPTILKTHEGIYSIWHSMVPSYKNPAYSPSGDSGSGSSSDDSANVCYSLEELRTMIVDDLTYRYMVALYSGDIAWLGHILHTIQDSFARGHTKRITIRGKSVIVNFYDFSKQDKVAHINNDSLERVIPSELLPLYYNNRGDTLTGKYSNPLNLINSLYDTEKNNLFYLALVHCIAISKMFFVHYDTIFKMKMKTKNKIVTDATMKLIMKYSIDVFMKYVDENVFIISPNIGHCAAGLEKSTKKYTEFVNNQTVNPMCDCTTIVDPRSAFDRLLGGAKGGARDGECNAMTKNNSRCKNKTSKGSKYCHVHST